MSAVTTDAAIRAARRPTAADAPVLAGRLAGPHRAGGSR